mmetsp:Transcript_5891/g.8903  ORF Transcript_5891/g.8903 Transcript_5891/m.8903 type:complete len:141 (+) Transcript_5891:96-518(+)
MSSQTSPLLFLIVGRNEPLYSAEFTTSLHQTSDSITRQNYFVLHSALDLVDKNAFVNNQMYLKTVDKVNHQMVSVFLTAGHVKFMLLHSGKADDLIRNFFMDVFELYVKLSMNPFYKFDTQITTKDFDDKVKTAGRRYLL